MNYVDTYKHLTILKIWLGEIDKAHKIIEYAVKVKAMDKSTILGLKSMILEIQGRYKDAEGILTTARLLSLNCDTINWLNMISNRIKAKKKEFKKMRKQSKKESGNRS